MAKSKGKQFVVTGFIAKSVPKTKFAANLKVQASSAGSASGALSIARVLYL